ncbi:MAG: hypothetical protein LBH20_03200 [Treponema sp.]|nr:hypothetical protein [Treponema sp.]
METEAVKFGIFKLILPLLTTCLLSCFIAHTNNPDKNNNNGYIIEDYPVRRELKPYSPDKAGAVIVESYDITGYAIFPDKNYLGRGFDRNEKKITAPYSLAADNDSIYIYVQAEKKIHVVDKKTMKKTREVSVHFPDPGLSDTEYKMLMEQGQAFYDIRRLVATSKGLIITEEKVFFLSNYNHPLPVYLFSVDLKTGNTVLLNVRETLGIELIPHYMLMGYDKGNDLVWFWTATETTPGKLHFRFHYFRYDMNTQTFIAEKTVDAPRNVGISNESLAKDIEICGDEVWYYSYHGPNPAYEIWDIIIDKRHIDNPTEMLSYIDIEHLGTLSVPQSIIYDNPYIWIMAERNEQIQMLKLLPNE